MNGSKRAYALLKTWFQLNRIPHALLFLGVKGTGKRELAELFANFLLCQHTKNILVPCYACKNCLLFKASTHPDFQEIIVPENKIIKIDTVRAVCEWVNTKPQQSNYRIVLLPALEYLNGQAANALLKTLEEPCKNVLFLLLSTNKHLIPATLFSRCQVLECKVEDDDSKIDDQQLAAIKEKLVTLQQLMVGTIMPHQLVEIWLKDKVEEVLTQLLIIWADLLKLFYNANSLLDVEPIQYELEIFKNSLKITNNLQEAWVVWNTLIKAKEILHLTQPNESLLLENIAIKIYRLA